MVYLSRTPTPGSLAVSEETVRYLLKVAEKIPPIRAGKEY
jgi:hypothetical protein